MLKPGVIVLFVFVIYSFILITLNESKMAITNVATCKGPKRKDCCINDIRVINATLMSCDMLILEDVMFDKVKLTVYVDGKLLMKLHVKKPCDHLFFKPLFRLSHNMTKDCSFKKGNYSLSYNMEDVMKHGGLYQFLTGHLKAQVVFYNDDCNFSCTVFEAELTT